MAGMMRGAKGIGSHRLRKPSKKPEPPQKPKGAKAPPAKEAPVKGEENKGGPKIAAQGAAASAPGASGVVKKGKPRSVQVREAEGGFILSKHGGDDDDGMGFPKDHVAADFDAAMNMAREHLGAQGAAALMATMKGPAGGRVNKASHTP